MSTITVDVPNNNDQLDDGAFYKSLASDVESTLSLRLLNEVYDTNELWSEFTEDDLLQIVEVFSILRMTPNEKLITKGEYATFCGIVLQGVFHALVTPSLVVPLKSGDLLGEMSLFEGGSRTADVVTDSSLQTEYILAVITFVDLDNLAMNDRYTMLARKLTNMFAAASIKKLRGMVNKTSMNVASTSSTESSSNPSTPLMSPIAGSLAPGQPLTQHRASFMRIPSRENPQGSGTGPPPSTTNVTASSPPASVITSPKASSIRAVKRAEREKQNKRTIQAETLYKNKMNKNAANNANGTGGAGPFGSTLTINTSLNEPLSANSTTSNGNSTTPRNINEAQQVLEAQYRRTKKLEHDKKNQQVMLEKLQRQLAENEEKRKEEEVTTQQAKDDLLKSLEIQQQLKEKYDKQSFILEEAMRELDTEKKDRVVTEGKVRQSVQEMNDKHTDTITQLKNELEQTQKHLRDVISSYEVERSSTVVQNATKSDESMKYAKVYQDVQAEKDRLSKEVISLKQTIVSLETDLRFATHSRPQQEAETKQHTVQLQAKIQETEDRLHHAMQWKLKALEFQSGLDAEKKRNQRVNEEWNNRLADMTHENRQYKHVLKHFIVAIYVKESRLRKLLGAIHKAVSEMLLKTLEEHYQTSSGGTAGNTNGAGGTMNGGSNNSVNNSTLNNNDYSTSAITTLALSSTFREKSMKGVATSLTHNTNNERSSSPSSSNSSQSTTASILASSSPTSITSTFKAVRKRKRAYLDTLLRPTTKLRDIVLSLEDEFSKLRAPFEEIRERCLHWRATSESFFLRNIDLAAKLMTLEKTMQEQGQIGANVNGNGGMGTLAQRGDLAAALAAIQKESNMIQQAHSNGGTNGKHHVNGKSDHLHSHHHQHQHHPPHSPRNVNATSTKHTNSHMLDPSSSSSTTMPPTVTTARANGSNIVLGHTSSPTSSLAAREVEALESRASILRVQVQQMESYLNQSAQAASQHALHQPLTYQPPPVTRSFGNPMSQNPSNVQSAIAIPTIASATTTATSPFQQPQQPPKTTLSLMNKDQVINLRALREQQQQQQQQQSSNSKLPALAGAQPSQPQQPQPPVTTAPTPQSARITIRAVAPSNGHA